MLVSTETQMTSYWPSRQLTKCSFGSPYRYCALMKAMTLHCCPVYIRVPGACTVHHVAKGSFGQKYVYLYINCQRGAAHGNPSHAEIKTQFDIAYLFHSTGTSRATTVVNHCTNTRGVTTTICAHITSFKPMSRQSSSLPCPLQLQRWQRPGPPKYYHWRCCLHCHSESDHHHPGESG